MESRKPGPELRRSDSARNAAVERREARRPASLAGDPWRSRDRPDREAGHGVRRSAPAPVGALPPFARGQTETTAYPAPQRTGAAERWLFLLHLPLAGEG